MSTLIRFYSIRRITVSDNFIRWIYRDMIYRDLLIHYYVDNIF